MRFTLAIISFLALSVSPACAQHDHDHGHGHGHGHDAAHEEPKRGPHGGRLLEQDGFALEVSIFEKGVPPQFRVFPYIDNKPVSPAGITTSIRLERFGGKKSQFDLTAEADYLTSKITVDEPHSFEVSVRASKDGREYSWDFSSHEGRTELSDEALKVAKLGFDIAGPAQIASEAHVYGRVLPNENRVAHLTPRFPGVIREIRKQLGDQVAKGEVLAVIESNQSLQPYEIRTQVAGVVIKRHATLGEFVTDSREIFVVADLSEVWADFQVYRDDFDQIQVGHPIKITIGDGRNIDARVSYVSPVTDEATQSKLVRTILENPDGRLRPGLFITGTLLSAESPVPLAIKREAIQTFRDWNVVYLSDGHAFQAMPVELGRQDKAYVEVLSGIEIGDKYVTTNSYVVKADIEKAGASHDH